MKYAIKEINKNIRDTLTEDEFDERIRYLLKRGLIEIVDCEDDGIPIVKVSKMGLDQFDKFMKDKNN